MKMDQTHSSPLHILTKQPNFVKNHTSSIPQSPFYRCSWSSDSGYPEDVGSFVEIPVVRRAFAVDIKESRRRVISLGSEPEHLNMRRLQLSELDVRRIVNEILDEFQHVEGGECLGRVRRISSTSCSTCFCSAGSTASCCYDCSPSPTLKRQISWPHSTLQPLDVPHPNPQPRKLPEIHSTSTKPRRFTSSDNHCTCYSSYFHIALPHSPSIWPNHHNSCRKCLPIVESDSLNSTISDDSLDDSIFSMDSLNSLTDKDSLEYAPTTLSDDSLNSIDCNFDSLSESKDSGFFSCSLPAIC